MQNQHDRLAKDYLDLVLSDIGTVVTEWEVAPRDAQRADLWFQPKVPPDDPGLIELGWLGRMVASRCLIEPFSGGPTEGGGEDLDRKLLTARAPERDSDHVSALVMWVLCARRPRALKATLGLVPMPAWPSGFYQRTGRGWLRVVSLPELPCTLETLPLRLLGQGRVQAQARREFDALHANPAWKVAATRLTQRLKLVENQRNAKKEETMVDISAVLAWEDEVRRKGHEAGREEGQLRALRTTLVTILTARGWSVTDALRQRIETTDLTQLNAFIATAVTAPSLDAVFTTRA